MSKKTVDPIKSTVVDNADTKHPKLVSILWFGGQNHIALHTRPEIPFMVMVFA